MIVYTEGRDEAEVAEAADDEGKKLLPPLTNGELLDLLGLFPEQHFTQPPPRYTEATLIKALEEKGIGRPSTYAPTLSTIQDRGYVERIEGRRLKPTEIGFIINDLLVKHFPEIVDVGFTAGMEEQLDDIATGERQWVPVMREFYDPFKGMLDRAEIEMEPVTMPVETTDIVCEKCGALWSSSAAGSGGSWPAPPSPSAAMRVRSPWARASPARSARGELVEKKTRRKRIFYSCGRFPDCKFAVWNRPVAAPCPSCGGLLTESTKKDGGKYICQACGSVLDELPALPAAPEGPRSRWHRGACPPEPPPA